MNYKNPYEKLSGKLNNRKLVNAGFSEKTYDTGSVKLNYVVGPKNGPSLLLIPAQMGMWESYKKVLLPLSKIFQVYAIDVRVMESLLGHRGIIHGKLLVRT